MNCKFSKQITKPSVCAIIIACIACDSICQSPKDIQVSGYKNFKFGMSSAQTLAQFTSNSELKELESGLFIQARFAPVTSRFFLDSPSPNALMKKVLSYGSVSAYLDSAISSIFVEAAISDRYSHAGKVSVINFPKEGIQLYLINDSLRQIRLDLTERKPDGDIFEVLTAKYGKPKISNIFFKTAPVIGTNSTLTSFTFDAIGGRVRLLGTSTKIELLNRSGPSDFRSKSNQKDPGQAYIDSGVAELEAQFINQTKALFSKMEPIQLTYTQLDFAIESEKQLREFTNKWKKESRDSIEKGIIELKRKNADEY
ncbi:MAG: hypothetical protein IPK50_17720 [Fibrobacterota bacterium]|nr:MAG: hypothetical protein IPK50_17720 [Fibrobacterota bacterium]